MTTTKPATTSGIPTAKGHFPVGTPASVCIDHNRACKVARLVTAAQNEHYDEHITDDELDGVADRAAVRRPGSDDTRDAVRAGLAAPYTNEDCNQDVAEAVRDAVDRGRPFQYLDGNRRVLLVALPIGEE